MPLAKEELDGLECFQTDDNVFPKWIPAELKFLPLSSSNFLNVMMSSPGLPAVSSAEELDGLECFQTDDNVNDLIHAGAFVRMRDEDVDAPVMHPGDLCLYLWRNERVAVHTGCHKYFSFR